MYSGVFLVFSRLFLLPTVIKVYDDVSTFWPLPDQAPQNNP